MAIIRVTVDAVIVEKGKILLIRRGRPPYKDFWALPGGFVEYGETVEDAVVREVKEETGLTCDVVRLTGVYSAPDRDPRGHTISTAFVMKVKSGDVSPGDDAAGASWFSIQELPDKIAFDHGQIIKEALNKG
ncbi:MAG: NUDIX hydrolase [Theionarchaea archaeon]|nr:NUDIX hydrolase [Theionarchaea archaeon]